ncbi:MAG: DsbA family protein [Lactobacillus sp.]|nr:DsbA family protein [Lactobacillus sp.]
MFEVYLFVNPIGIYCYDVECQTRLATDELNLKISLHYIPLVNQQAIIADIKHRRLNCEKIDHPVAYTQLACKALHYYHAIKFNYGNRAARNFLATVQDSLKNDCSSCYFIFFDEVCRKLHLDINDIHELLDSAEVADSIDKDQELAELWHIESVPTTVIFDLEEDQGTLIDGKIDCNDLMEIFSNHSYNPHSSKYSLRKLRLL